MTRDGAPAALLIEPDDPPTAIRGRRSVSAALDRLDDYALIDKEAESRPIGCASAGDALGVYARQRRLRESRSAPGRIAAQTRGVGLIAAIGRTCKITFVLQNDSHKQKLLGHCASRTGVNTCSDSRFGLKSSVTRKSNPSKEVTQMTQFLGSGRGYVSKSNT